MPWQGIYEMFGFLFRSRLNVARSSARPGGTEPHPFAGPPLHHMPSSPSPPLFFLFFFFNRVAYLVGCIVDGAATAKAAALSNNSPHAPPPPPSPHPPCPCVSVLFCSVLCNLQQPWGSTKEDIVSANLLCNKFPVLTKNKKWLKTLAKKNVQE